MEQISRSVRDFVLPLEPSGSLDASLSFQLEEDAAQQGTRLHGRIQRRLAEEHPDLVAERTLLCTLEREDFACVLRGRIDVLFPGQPPLIEEIKSTYRPGPLLRALTLDPQHPFAQQVRMYAWMHHRGTGEEATCRLRVVSLLDEAETLVEVPYDHPTFDRWVQAQLDGLHRLHLLALQRAADRRETARSLSFPFSAPRTGQVDLLDLVGRALDDGERLLVQAPTGLGKTAAVLHPALHKALLENLRVFYLTPRNSQHAVAEAYVRRLREAGHGVRSVTLRAKERVCPQDEVLCTPEACPRALGYYDRLAASGALDRLAELGCADGAALEAEADAHLLCPFELALDASRRADVIIGDYNYALSPNATLQRYFGEEEEGRNLLLLDEAHNLPARAADWFSPELDTALLGGLRKGWRAPKGKGRGLKAAFLKQLDRCIALVASHEGPERALDVDPGLFGAEETRIRHLVARAGAAGLDLPASHVLVQLHQQWAAFCGVLRERTEAHLLTWTPPGRLAFRCVDASAYLAERFQPLAGAVLFSATLKPFSYYLHLSGLKGARQAEVPSPFPREHRRVLVVPQVSTLYRRRDQEIPRIAAFVSRVLPLRHGNYLVFFPSFDFLERVLPHLDLPGFEVMAQPRRAQAADLEALLEAFRTRRGVVVLAVQGGSLSEGVDLPGEALIGTILVGPPIPPFDLQRRLAQDYFDRTVGDGEGYTCTYPAMARAIQAAGRVIRGPRERGLIVLLDRRFLDPGFAACYPADWFERGPEEAVSRQILADVQAFWEGEP